VKVGNEREEVGMCEALRRCQRGGYDQILGRTWIRRADTLPSGRLSPALELAGLQRFRDMPEVRFRPIPLILRPGHSPGPGRVRGFGIASAGNIWPAARLGDVVFQEERNSGLRCISGIWTL